ncbi:LamG domain-containing protein [Massilia horti]|uniref:LamG domain-containing protein n=1 Tax=Massilia horti TaxID=2562153 RepID=A0A4Y9SXZ9_9BURK|nr:LamG domain-containing protein [Massilia horti]TFW31726.1 LamG domain-containing protein [Massilia horti]
MKPPHSEPRRRLLRAGVSLSGLALPPGLALAVTPVHHQWSLWVFDNLERVGGLPVKVEGAPQLIDTPLGTAVQFDGVHDALFIDQHPLAGAATFTFEAFFRPDGGAFEQRWFHLASDEPAPAPGQPPASPPSGTRFLFEIRVVDDTWYLDTYTHGAGYGQTLIFPDRRYPLGQWYHVAQTFDGRMYRAYVNGQLQGEAEVPFKPQGPGKASVGVRMNRVNYFKGAIRAARFTHAALSPAQFMSMP